MPDPRPDREAEPGRPTFADLRADYDDDFQHLWTPFERARRMVFGPAIAFIGIGSVGVLGMLVLSGGVLVVHIDDMLVDAMDAVGWGLVVALTLLGVLLFAMVIAGGVSMLQMRRRWLGLWSAYVVTGLSVGGCYAILLYPFGIWGLIVLYRPDVREQFRRRPPPRDERHGEL
jgi:hypothetical protein